MGKKILVTGGGSGLGQSMARKFAELGATVIVCGRTLEKLQGTVDSIQKDFSQKAHAMVCDVRKPDEIEKMLDQIWSTGPLHGLVNNAAGNFLSRFEDLSPNAVDSVLNIVLHGTSYMTLACGKRWIAAGDPGHVLNIVTTYATTGSAYVVPSAMAKAGVLAMTRSLAVEWGPKKIRLNAVAPGPFPTKGAWEKLVPNPQLEKVWMKRIPVGRLGEHEELANLASFLLSDYAAYIQGEVITIDGAESLKGAGQFSFLGDYMGEKDWDAMKAKKPAK